ncbi:hypothetical protein BX265_1637 [Streptomyces sp. TLI_235]|nr:hypothetical protein BX265_1637 [Streptomyces sp. TLI_235]
MPRPMVPMANANEVSSRSGSMVASSQTIEASRTRKPIRTMVRGEAMRRSTEPPIEAISMVTDTGSSLSPVSKASLPSTTWR